MRRKYFVRYNTDGSIITNCDNPLYEVSEDGKTITNLKVDNIYVSFGLAAKLDKIV